MHRSRNIPVAAYQHWRSTISCVFRQRMQWFCSQSRSSEETWFTMHQRIIQHCHPRWSWKLPSRVKTWNIHRQATNSQWSSNHIWHLSWKNYNKISWVSPGRCCKRHPAKLYTIRWDTSVAGGSRFNWWWGRSNDKDKIPTLPSKTSTPNVNYSNLSSKMQLVDEE